MMFDVPRLSARTIPTARSPRESVEKLLVLPRTRRGLLPALRLAGVGHRARRPCDDGGRRDEARDRAARARLARSRARCSTSTGDWADAAARRAARRLGVPVQQRPLPRSRRHRRRRRWRWTARRPRGGDDDEAIARGGRMDGGHADRATAAGAAFDADNAYHYLNNIPFADHGALLDPPTADVSARCVSLLAQLGEPRDTPRMTAGARLAREGAGARRQLVRPLGGQLHLRHLVGAVRAQRRRGRSADHPMVAQGGRLARPRSRTPTAAGARIATAMRSTARATSPRPRPPRRPPGRCSG